MSLFLTTLELDQARQIYRQVIKDQLERSSGYSHPAFEAYASSISGPRGMAFEAVRSAAKAMPATVTYSAGGLAGQIWQSCCETVAQLRQAESSVVEPVRRSLAAAAEFKTDDPANDGRKNTVTFFTDALNTFDSLAGGTADLTKVAGGVSLLIGAVPNPGSPAMLIAGANLLKISRFLTKASSLASGTSTFLDFSSKISYGGDLAKAVFTKATSLALSQATKKSAKSVHKSGDKLLDNILTKRGVGQFDKIVFERHGERKVSPLSKAAILKIGALTITEVGHDWAAGIATDVLAEGAESLVEEKFLAFKGKATAVASAVAQGLNAAAEVASILSQIIDRVQSAIGHLSFIPPLVLNPFKFFIGIAKGLLIGFERSVSLGRGVLGAIQQGIQTARSIYGYYFSIFVDNILAPARAWLGDFLAKLNACPPVASALEKAQSVIDGFAKAYTLVKDGIKKGAEFAKNLVVGGYNKVKGFGVSLFEKARDGIGVLKEHAIQHAAPAIAFGKGLVTEGVSKARGFGEGLFHRFASFGSNVKAGAVNIGEAILTKSEPVTNPVRRGILNSIGWLKKQFATPPGLADGELSGPFHPFANKWTPETPDAEVAKDLAAIQASSTPAQRFAQATSGALVVINGVLNDPVSHARFVQSVADRHKALSIGVYNATNSILDFVQYSADSLRVGKNPAVDSLVSIIEARKGKLNLFAHSHGTMITQRAYELAQKRGKLGDPSTVLRRYYGDAAGEADDDPNLTIYSNINDYVSMFLGHGSLRSLATNLIHNLTFGFMGEKPGRSAKTAFGFSTGDPHNAVNYAETDPFNLEGVHEGSPNGKVTVQADVSGGGPIQYGFFLARLESLKLSIRLWLAKLGWQLIETGAKAAEKGGLWLIKMGGKALGYLKKEAINRAEAVKQMIEALARQLLDKAIKGFRWGVNALKGAATFGMNMAKGAWGAARSAGRFLASKIKSGVDKTKAFVQAAAAKAKKKALALAEKAYQKAMAVKAKIEKAQLLAHELKKKALNAAKFIANKATEGVINTAVKAKDFVVGAAVFIGQTGKAAAAWAEDKIDEGLDAARGAATFAAGAAKSAVSAVANSAAKGWNWLWGQRMEEGPGGLQESGEPSGPAASSLKGTSLAPGLIRAAGKAFGADFSGVRLHQGMEAAHALAGMGARAMASGGSVFFAPGEFNAGDSQGLHLIGHELAHVVQQGRGGLNPSQLTESGRTHFEREADDQAGELLTSLRRQGQHFIARHAVSVQAADGASVSRSQVGYLEGLMEIVHSRVVAKLAGREDLPKEAPSLSVRLECDLERMTAAEIVEAWASAILQEIESKASQAALPAKLSFPAKQKAEDGEVHHFLPERGQKQTVPGTTKQEPAKSQEPAKPAAKKDVLAGNVAQNDGRFQVEKGAFTMAREGVEYTKGYQSPAAQKSRVRHAQAVKALESASANLKTAEEKVALLDQQASPSNKSKEAVRAKKSLTQAKLAYGRAEKALKRAEDSKAKAEVNEKAQQGSTSRLFHWPGGTSGLTLGAGYDMKLRDTQQIKGHLTKAGVDPATAASVARMNVIFRNRGGIEGEGGKAMKEAALISLMNRSFSADPKEAEAAQGEILPLYKQALEIEAKAGAPNSNVKESKGSPYTLGKDKKRSAAETDEKIADLMAQFEQEMKDSGTNRALKSSPIFVTNTDPDLAGARPESPSDPMSAYSPGAMKPLPSAVGVYGPQPASKDSHLTHGILTPEEQKGLFETVYPEYEKEARRRFGFTEEQWVGLPQDARDLLADMTYQGTPQKSAKNPMHVDFAAMKTAILSGDKAAMKSVLEKGYPNDSRMLMRNQLIDTMDLPARKKEAGEGKKSNSGESKP